jgi:hypothetical protein
MNKKKKKKENTTYQNLWNTSKAVLRRKFVTMSAYVKNIEKLKKNLETNKNGNKKYKNL